MKDEYAPNSTGQSMHMYEGGEDSKRLHSQSMPNTRANSYVTNQFAGGGVHSTKAKVKGHEEHKGSEDELGHNYGL